MDKTGNSGKVCELFTYRLEFKRQNGDNQMHRKFNRYKKLWIGLLAVVSLSVSACGAEGMAQGNGNGNSVAANDNGGTGSKSGEESVDSIEDVPEYTGEPYVEINENQPEFTEDQMTTKSYENYSPLDELGRCQTAEACIGEDLMPTEKRESISSVKPSGWENKKYDVVDGGYLYNRCHLIGFQLTGENANEKNLITGTRYMNVEGMLPFEDKVADYIHETDNHVLYRVTPIFEEDDLVASGVQMEAKSVEDDGAGVSFNVYVYNVQPYIAINYENGDSYQTEELAVPEGEWAFDAEDDVNSSKTDSSGASENSDKKNATKSEKKQTYILNTNTKKFHKPDCASIEDIKEENKEEYKGTRTDLTSQGYEPCGRCKP